MGFFGLCYEGYGPFILFIYIVKQIFVIVYCTKTGFDFVDDCFILDTNHFVHAVGSDGIFDFCYHSLCAYVRQIAYTKTANVPSQAFWKGRSEIML